MESEYFLTDKNGQRIDNLQKYYDENPEILKKHIERLNENNNWEPSESLFNPEKVKLLIEVHDVGVFRKACEKFYLDWLNEINSHSANENFLLEQKEKAQDFIDESKIKIAYRPDNVVIMENGNYLIATMESLQNKINRFLSRLEREKAKGNPTGGRNKKSGENRVLAYNNGGNDEENVIDAMEKIEMILNKINDLLFVGSTPTQWEKLLKGEKLTEPIILEEKVTIKDFKYFIKSLKNKVLKGRIYEDLGRANAFLYEGELLIGKQIQKVDESTDAKLKKQIDKIISDLD